MKRWMEGIIVFLLILFMIFSVLGFINSKAPICDEVSHHIASGYSYVKMLDYRMNPATPSLIRTFIGLPLLFLGMDLPVDHISWQTNDSPVFGRLFLYEYNDFSDKIVFFARFPILILSVCMALLVYAWTRELYGSVSALFALFLYSLSPNVLGNSGLAMADIGGAFFIFLSMYTFWRFLKAGGILQIAICGVSFGFAQASKHTAVVLVPLFFFVIFICASKEKEGIKLFFKRMKGLFLIFCIGFIAIWATYSFEFKPLLENAPDVEEKVEYINAAVAKIPFIDQAAVGEKAVYFAKYVPIPLSSFMVSLLGVSNQVLVSGQPLFFMGEKHITGIKLYYFFLFLIKTPIPVIFMLFLSIIMAFLRKRSRVSIETNLCLILPAVFVLASVSMSKVQGGMRYLLPAYPFLLVWIADTVNISFRRKAIRSLKYGILTILIIWYAAGSLSIRPDYLGFYNELAGGSDGNAYKITHDMDWGQDLKPLGEYVKKNNIPEVTIFYFGTAEPASYGITAREITESEQRVPEKRVYAVSVRYLDAVEWTERYQPTAKAGCSIFIYDFREEVEGQ